MLEKFIKEKKLNSVAEVRLYVLVLEMLENVVQLLENPLGNFCVCAWLHVCIVQVYLGVRGWY